MRSRSEDILFATVAHFIRSGEPVSSKFLFKEYDFGIRPASIRAELNGLEADGWLSQPYTSGGRVPTDKAYELFAQRARTKLAEPTAVQRDFTALARALVEDSLESFIGDFADEVHALGVGFSTSQARTAKSGLDELFSQIDAHESNVFRDIAKDFEMLEERVLKCLKHTSLTDNGPQVAIGGKSPFVKNEYLATVYDRFTVGGDDVLIITVGSKRMDYERSLKALFGIRRALLEFE